MSRVSGPRKVAFVAHCLANQNAKVSEFAKCAGAVTPLIDRLQANGYELQQLPCPEMSHLGVVRWWGSREQYDTPGYRRHCRALARPVADSIALHVQHGYDVVIIGLDGSPSSGVRLTSTKPSWGGRPESGVAGGADRIPGMGVWMDELKKELDARGMAWPRATGIAMDAQTFDMDASMREIDAFLAGAEAAA